MLQSIRNRFRGGFAIFILVLIAVPFVLFFGAESFFFNRDPNVVLLVNDEEISSFQVDEQQNLQYQNLRARYGDRADSIDDARLRNAALETIIVQTINRQSLQEAGLVVAPKQLTDHIAKIPQFQKDGKFSASLFNQYLTLTGQSTGQLSRSLRNEVRYLQASSALLQGIAMPLEQAGELAALMGEKRSFNVINIALAERGSGYEPEESAQKQWYEDNTQLYQHPERRTIRYIRLDQALMAEQVEVSEDEVRAEYERIVERAKNEQGIRASAIVLQYGATRSKEEAQSLASDLIRRIGEGEDFGELVSEHSDDAVSAGQGGDLGWSNQGGVYPQSFLQVLQDKQKGDLTQADTGDAVVVLRMEELQSEEVASYEEQAEQIKRSIRESDARRRYDEQHQLLQQYGYEYTDIDEVAGLMSMAVINSTPYTLEGTNSGPGANSKVLEAVFAYEEGQMSEAPIDLADGKTVLFQLSAIEPARDMTYEEAASQVRESLVKENALAERDSLIEQIRESLKSGDSFTETAARLKLKWDSHPEKTRAQVQAEYADLVFSLALPADKDNPVYASKVLDSEDAVVIELSEVSRVNPASSQSVDSAAQLERARVLYAQGVLDARGQIIQSQADIVAPSRPEESN